MIATSGFLVYSFKMHQIRLLPGLRPIPLLGSLQRSPRPLAGLRGPYTSTTLYQRDRRLVRADVLTGLARHSCRGWHRRSERRMKVQLQLWLTKCRHGTVCWRHSVATWRLMIATSLPRASKYRGVIRSRSIRSQEQKPSNERMKSRIRGWSTFDWKTISS